MRASKIVLIGAASSIFGHKMIHDAVLSPELKGSTLALVDTDAERLEVMAAYARRVNEAAGAGLRIEQATDRGQALPGAEFVIMSVAIQRDELWKLDFAIPQKYGIKQVLGENGGPGGLSHALRNIPLILEIAKDVEKLCPDALLLSFTNPESRICMALDRYTDVRFVGLCTGAVYAHNAIGRITGVPPEDIHVTTAGINHFGWVLDVRRKSTQEDLYPLLREADKTYDPSFYPLCRRMMGLYGLYPYPSDNHIGEYLSFGWESCGVKGYDFAAAARKREETWARIVRVARGEARVPEVGAAAGQPASDSLPLTKSQESAFPLILSVLGDRHQLIEAVNVRNDGLVPNLPDWAIVEVPVVAGADGVKGVKVGPLPAGIAALVSTQVHVQDLVVEAAVKGSRSLALQAMLADPVVQSAEAAEKCLDELLAAHAAYLPRFRR